MTLHHTPATNHRNAAELPLIVQSHLRWDFVWQRPQQLLSRMAATSPVLFVEEPHYLDDVHGPRLDVSSPQRGLYRAVPHLPARLRELYDDSAAAVRTLVQRVIGKGGQLDGLFVNAVQWFYTPMPAPVMLGAFNERGVVYDCMDELAQFRFAPSDLPRREELLLSNADVIFTGGYKLYQSKSRRHGNVHFFGCGVDSRHFAKARLPETPLPSDVADVVTPVIGYFGVIDERLDYELIRRIAEAHRDATVVMVGPVVKVDPGELPQAANIRWLGQRAYAELPAYVKSFDVCLMPFALNDATEYINPTKTLEYMAAGRPIVSTAVADVVRNFTPVVRVANSHEEFVAAVSEALAGHDEALIAEGIRRAQGASWESIVRQMRTLIADAVADPTDAATLDGIADEWTADERPARVSGSSQSSRGAVAAGEELGA